MSERSVGPGPTDPSIDPTHEEEVADLLDSLGVDSKPARVLGFLAAQGEGRSVEIERACDLRQPEVSQATKALRERGWVVATPEKTPGKGRPVNNYSLNIPLEDIVAEVEARRREQINKELARLDRLKQIADVAPEAAPAGEVPIEERL